MRLLVPKTDFVELYCTVDETRLLVPMRVLQSCIVTVAWDEITCPYEGFTELYCYSSVG